MKILNGFYFSGTGNTQYVAEKILSELSEEYNGRLYAVTGKKDYSDLIRQADLILLAFPIYGSAPPIPMREFVHKYGKVFKNKKFIIAETQYFFSGDGAASLGRTVEKYGGIVIDAEHFNMPNNLSDCKLFPVRNGDELGKHFAKTNKKIAKFTKNILQGKTVRRGFGIVPHAVGYFSQRLFWRKNEASKRDKLKISAEKCIGCGLCAKKCPLENIKVENGKAHAFGKCALCYRCVNICPKQAITLIGSTPPTIQYRGPIK